MTNTLVSNRLLSHKELAKYCNVPERTVYQWNTKGTGPKRFRIGRHVRYRLADVEAWLEQQAIGGGEAA